MKWIACHILHKPTGQWVKRADMSLIADKANAWHLCSLKKAKTELFIAKEMNLINIKDFEIVLD